MTSTTEKRYFITFEDMSQITVTADTIHEPDDGIRTSKVRFYVLELDGEVVAKYKDTEVVGWRIVPPGHGGIAPHPHTELYPRRRLSLLSHLTDAMRPQRPCNPSWQV